MFVLYEPQEYRSLVETIISEFTAAKVVALSATLQQTFKPNTAYELKYVDAISNHRHNDVPYLKRLRIVEVKPKQEAKAITWRGKTFSFRQASPFAQQNKEFRKDVAYSDYFVQRTIQAIYDVQQGLWPLGGSLHS